MRLVNRERRVRMDELKEMAEARFGDLVKAVVDIEQEIMAVDAELHSDQEAFLLESGSKQADLWGINLYPELKNEDFLEFDSMINLRPSQGNRSRWVEDPVVCGRITEIVRKLVLDD
jgi:hypothetical protein